MSSYTACEVCGAPATNVFGAVRDLGEQNGWRLCAPGELHAYCDDHTPTEPSPVVPAPDKGDWWDLLGPGRLPATPENAARWEQWHKEHPRPAPSTTPDPHLSDDKIVDLSTAVNLLMNEVGELRAQMLNDERAIGDIFNLLKQVYTELSELRRASHAHP